MANLYFAESAEPGAFEAGARLELRGEEARHAARVSRVRVGEPLLVGDGVGTVASGAVELVERDRVVLRVETRRREPASRPRVTLVQALAKGEHDARAVQLATEFGVDRIIPFEAARSVARWGREKGESGPERWRRIARESAKQSVRAWIPEVSAPVGLERLGLAVAATGTRSVLLHPGAPERLSDWARTAWRVGAAAPDEVLLLVGPEGGFTPQELTALERVGAERRSLGPTVLRTSSAGAAALAVINAVRSRW